LRLGELVTERKNQGRNSFRERSKARYTTAEILKMEGLMLGSVERMAQKSAAIDPSIAEVAIASRKHLAEEQKNAVRHLTAADGSRIACMTGKAGTGKSTTLDTCRLAWETAGHKVIGCALAGVAADELRRSSGIEGDTLTRTLMRLEYGRLTLTRNHVVVLDEAGMVATKPMAELVRHIEQAGAKLVLVGDAAQLQAIGAGGPFRSIAERVGQCELTQIRRQREEWRRQTVEHFSRGEAREALTAYAAQNQLHVTETREEAIGGLVERWKADHSIQNPKDVLLLASLNAEVRAINVRVLGSKIPRLQATTSST
jgi:ATP-dependent exoDNAse (exonuclease V) alpha subunit